MSKKALLAILDGWGLGTNPEASAIEQAHTPFMDSLYHNFPHTLLIASGAEVGLPKGQMGNSEVGHTNLGAGRVVYQNLVRLNNAVENNTLIQEPVLAAAFEFARNNAKNLHFIGLVSDGGVHSHINHLKGLLKAAADFGLKDKVYVHAFTDGRDTDPKSGLNFLNELQQSMLETTGQLATVVGRYYAMDRDRRWERVAVAYNAMVLGEGTRTQQVLAEIQKSYDEGITDEFLMPLIMTDASGAPLPRIQDGDVVISFNFRTDRGREYTEVLTQHAFPEFGMKPLDLYYVTLTNYDKTFQNIRVVFDESTLQQTLGEVIADHGLTQIRVAETEKYPHVTFFFSGGREDQFSGEKRILCPSPKDVPTYDLKPEMAARDITAQILPEIKNETGDFICLNFANTDMVGHTGVFSAAVQAAEVVDDCIRQVATAAYEHGYTVFILADHGNSDFMINEDGSPNTAHTTNLVPLIVMDRQKTWHLAPLGKLGDVAPSILTAMGLPVPPLMTGDILIS